MKGYKKYTLNNSKGKPTKKTTRKSKRNSKSKHKGGGSVKDNFNNSQDVNEYFMNLNTLILKYQDKLDLTQNLKKVYNKLSLIIHPDKNKGDGTEFQLLNSLMTELAEDNQLNNLGDSTSSIAVMDALQQIKNYWIQEWMGRQQQRYQQ
jgi:hypothetical protein